MRRNRSNCLKRDPESLKKTVVAAFVPRKAFSIFSNCGKLPKKACADVRVQKVLHFDPRKRPTNVITQP